MTTNERLKKARTDLKLTQEYVAKYLGVTRTAIVQIENGNRKISSDELNKLCMLYGVSSDYILGNVPDVDTSKIFARSFNALSEQDKMEILSLIEFKRQLALKNGRK